ncbi:FlgD immunoglobulin-like domain containing protein [Streptomyces sp. NL15-2K]|uniref:FlgD immunoglobulin-like domain containing protein n=1 Tax=Streptomyces sp. NL15-2K TaxID=376149 RepID=UPI000F55D12A|nr:MULTISPECIES: FlgD immunoglobulin-like domain containing protein [Actinomycetes]WKX10591.1 FlgD immunoglobulin-like domain containing protein [Kutzneria buriramensis]
MPDFSRRLALVLTVAAVPVLAGPPIAHAEDTGPAELVLTAPARYEPVEDVLYAAGDNGYLHRRETTDGSTASYQWRGYDGTERTVENFTGTLPDQQGYYGAGTDILPVPIGASGVVQLRDPATGESTSLTVPEGQSTVGSFGTTVLTISFNDVWQADKLHILRVQDGVTVDTPVDPPEGERFDRYPVVAGDGQLAVVRFIHGRTLGILDLATGALTPVSSRVAVDQSWNIQAAVSPTHIAWYQAGMTQARVVRRDDPAGAQTSVAVPTSDEGTSVVGLAGDWLLTSERLKPATVQNPPLRQGSPLKATPLGGGSPVTLLAAAQGDLAQIPGGGAIAVGGAGAGDWAVRRIEVAADGGLTLRTLSAVPAVPATVRGIALAGGQLVTKEEDSAPRPAYQTRKVTLTGTPSAGERSQVTTAPLGDSYGQPLGGGDGSVVHVRYDEATQRDVLVRATAAGARTEVVPFDRAAPSTSGRGLRDAAGRYAVYGGGDERVVVDFEAPGGGTVVQRLSTPAAALWGSELWTTDGTGGRIEARDLATGTVTSYSVGASCVIRDIQAVGRWVYWDCLGQDIVGGDESTPFGVYDLKTGANITLPERGELGDGFVVNHDTTAAQLRLTDFHTGTAAAPRPLTDLPAVSNWKNHDVDKFGGGVAWLDASGTAHVVPTGVPTEPLTATATSVDTGYARSAGATWNPVWRLSKPAAGAQLVIKDKKKIVRTLDATALGAALTARWDGTLADGTPVAAGTYTWQLTAGPEDGTGAALALTGTVTVTDGS